ncbi:MAG: hypothetical protein RMN52_06655 [Anaerolineae bacterium]|nr:hypothetical protein [Candidatus Roseilinea sp.]MDW8449667.1 hypothetical protein [Anaerolineae bacterium]
MKRYLLFDSGCAICRDLAHQIETESNGWLTARSLREPEIQRLLTLAHPNWRWEPTLLEVDGEQLQIYTGLRLRARMLTGMGLRRASRIAWLAWQAGRHSDRQATGRRKLLKGAGAFVAGAALSQLANPASAQSRVPTASSSTGPIEEYAGFILLPEGAPLPAFVQPPKLGIPLVCGVGANAGGPQPNAIVEQFATVDGLKQSAGIGLYRLDQITQNLQLNEGDIVRHETGELFMSIISYRTYDSQSGWITSIRLLAQPDYMRPYPIWYGNSNDGSRHSIVIEKVEFLPTSGIAITTAGGHAFHWIEDNVMHTLIFDTKISAEQMRAIINSLVKF